MRIIEVLLQDSPELGHKCAFVAAFFVLLVMPLLVMVGLSAIGLASGTGMMSEMNRMMNGGTGGLVLELVIIWVVLVLVAVLAIVALLLRRATRT